MQTLRTLVLVSAYCCSVLSVAEETPLAIEIFDAMDAGQVGVRFIATDEAHANVLVKNLTDQPLVIQLPEAIAAVPVLAQFGQGAGQGLGQGNGQNAGQNGGGNQSVGGNLNAGQGQAQGQGQGLGQRQGLGRGFMRIPPHKQVKLVASTVCLQHGKADPNPRVEYRMIRLNEYTNNKTIARLCREVGSSEMSQNTAQAIAWHLANGMSWDELTEVNSVESKYLGNIPYFQSRDIDLAKKWIESITKAPLTASLN